MCPSSSIYSRARASQGPSARVNNNRYSINNISRADSKGRLGESHLHLRDKPVPKIIGGGPRLNDGLDARMTRIKGSLRTRARFAVCVREKERERAKE